jgi:hypothetical protein
MRTQVNSGTRQFMRDELRELVWVSSAVAALSICATGLGVALALAFEGLALFH